MTKREMSNREYAIALQYVMANYRELYNYADIIVLVSASRFEDSVEGLCSHDNVITINDSLRTVGQYVNVLVHELTHAKQNATGKVDGDKEEEAYQAGIEAERDYMIKAAPWRTK